MEDVGDTQSPATACFRAVADHIVVTNRPADGLGGAMPLRCAL